MPRLEQTYNWGLPKSQDNKELYNQLNQSYEKIAFVVNTKPSKRVILNQNPPASADINRNFEIGDIWVREDANQAWIMTSRTTDIAVTWTRFSVA